MPSLASSISGIVGEGERADEQAHGEADPAQQRGAIDLAPAARRGAAREAERDGRADSAENAELLADEQAGRDRRAAAARAAGPSPPSGTPALAKPNSGTMPNITHGWMACSSRWSGDIGLAAAERDGRARRAPRRWSRGRPTGSTASHSSAKPTG